MIHPAKLMVIIWTTAFALFFALPFELTTRSFSWTGFGVLLLFILSFSCGAILKTFRLPSRRQVSEVSLGFNRFNFFIKIISIATIIVFAIEIIQNNSLNLSDAYLNRSSQAQALLHGDISNSSIWFKIGFLIYPASYIYIIKEIIFTQKIRSMQFAFYGLLPGVMSAIAMGGRATMFNIIAYSLLAYNIRRKRLSKLKTQNNFRTSKFKLFLAILLITTAFIYFVNVFIERAEVSGGSIYMLNIVGNIWGVEFSGPLYEMALQVFGPIFIFVIFVFSWYLLQGLVMSNYLLANYDGSPLLGVYGLDLASAVIRRTNPEWVSENFNYLLSLDTYGFLPSAYGSIFIDFKYFGLLIVMIWGWLAGLVYLRVKTSNDPRWLLVAPYVVFGIIFSLINTPLGYSNGLMSHLWLAIGFFLVKKYDQRKILNKNEF
ncbi:oligosaccharide repeat unit polymerase [Gammaproteobacteria bacterium]|nr:oligosaccharide repeat unit polymerase [Gammaproteobacteria bacterium]